MGSGEGIGLRRSGQFVGPMPCNMTLAPVARICSSILGHRLRRWLMWRVMTAPHSCRLWLGPQSRVTVK